MGLVISLFNSILDPELIEAVDVSGLSALADELEARTQGITYVDPDGKGRVSPVWSAVRLKGKKTRSLDANVEEVYCLVLDLDGKKGTVPSEEMVIELLSGWGYYAHTTVSSGPSLDRWRAVVEYSRPVTPKEHKRLWKMMEARCASHGLVLDPQTKDPRRLWLAPYPDLVVEDIEGNRESVFAALLCDGPSLDVDTLLAGSDTKFMDGDPTEVEELTEGIQWESLIFDTREGPVALSTWMRDSKPGARLAVACPLVSDASIGSAFLSRKRNGVALRCTSERHGHSSALIHWHEDPRAGGGRPKRDKSVISLLDQKMDANGNPAGPAQTLYNLGVILKNDPQWKGRFWWDERARAPMLDTTRVSDANNFEARSWVERVYRMKFKKDEMWDAIHEACCESRKNPLVDELERVKWDGRSRLDAWLIEAFGVADTPQNRVYGRKWLIQAMARLLDPGCQADSMLVLAGEQNLGKSTGIAALMGKQWTNASPLKIENHVRTCMTLNSAWVHEFAELATLRGARTEMIKAFITEAWSLYVPLHARATVKEPRACVFFGTTNEEQFLNDPTGDRRFWPVWVTKVDFAWIYENRQQVLAEALAAYRAWVERGSDKEERPWWLTEKEEQIRKEGSEQFREELPYEVEIKKWLGSSGIVAANTTQIVTEVLEEGGAKMRRREAQMVVADVMRKLGWKRRQFRVGLERVWAYCAPGIDEDTLNAAVRGDPGRGASNVVPMKGRV